MSSGNVLSISPHHLRIEYIRITLNFKSGIKIQFCAFFHSLIATWHWKAFATLLYNQEDQGFDGSPEQTKTTTRLMNLRLSVISYQNQRTSMPMGKVFGVDGGTIGRSADNDWVLPDPERFISGKHAEITLQNGQYCLTDISTNGIYLNHQPQPMGTGNSSPLADGDRIIIGDYEIEVMLEHSQQPAAIPPKADNDFFDSPPNPDMGGFGIPDLEDSPADITGPATNSLIMPPEEPLGGSEPDHVPAGNEFFQPPNSIPDDWDILGEETEDLDFPPSQLTVPTPEAVPVPPAVTQTPTSASDLVSLNKLLDGAGIKPIDVTDQDAGEILHIIGSLMQQMVGGLMDVLRARAEIKSEFRMQLTTIRPVENNPLKFSVSVEDALHHLLAPSNGAYLPPIEAVHQAVEDIQAHQMAVMAGMQAALSSMLQRFEPSALEDYFVRKGGRSLLESKKAWYWEQYAEKHKEILTEAEDNFQDLFGEEFARAYESQAAKLARARSNKKQ